MSEAMPAPASTEPVSPPARGRPRRWWIWRLPLYAALGYTTWCTMLYLYQDKLIFPVDMTPTAPTRSGLSSAGATRLQIDLDAGGQVEAFFIPTPNASTDRPAPLVIFCHGNAEIIDQQLDLVRGYHKLGCSVLLPEYRGYGRCAGTPSERGIVADAVRFYDLIREREDVDASRIVIHGRSLGGGVAAQLAARRKPAALILESTFISAAEMAHKYFAPMFLARHPFRTDRVITDLDVPLLIFHGTRDSIIPIAHGRRLRDLARGARYVEYDCDHNDFPGPGNHDAYWSETRAFLTGARIIK